MIEKYIKEFTPVIGYFELTLKCNLKCVQCYLEGDIPLKKEELTREEINEALGGLARLGTSILVATGGDIFMRKDTLDILRDMRRHGFAVVVFTNGTLISEKQADELKEIAPLGVEISVHGASAAIHDAITQMPGSFDKSLLTIKRLKERGIRVKLKCNLMKMNEGDYGSVMTLAESMGVEYKFDPYIFPRRDMDQDPVAQRLSDDVMEKILTDPKIMPRTSCEGAKSYLEIKENRLCGTGQNIIVVSSNGDVYPCIPLKLKAGNIRENSVEHVWHHSPTFQKLRGYTNADLEECHSCNLISVCGRCSAMAYNETGRVLGCAPASKKMAEVKIKILEKERERKGLLVHA